MNGEITDKDILAARQQAWVDYCEFELENVSRLLARVQSIRDRL